MASDTRRSVRLTSADWLRVAAMRNEVICSLLL